MKFLKGRIFGLLVLIGMVLPLQGMITRQMFNKWKYMQQYQMNKPEQQINTPKPGEPIDIKPIKTQQQGWADWFRSWAKPSASSTRYAPPIERTSPFSGMQKSFYSSTPEPQGSQFWNWVASFFEPKPSPTIVREEEIPVKGEEGPVQREIPIQEEIPVQQEEIFSDTITRRDEMFAFMEKELKVAEKYFSHLTGDDLSHIVNELYEYENVLNEEKDGHTILGKIISLYGFHLKTDIDKTRLFVPLHTIRAGAVLNFFREVEKLGAYNMTPNDIRKVEAIKKEFVSFVATRYKDAEELIPVKDIVEMADVFNELKGEEISSFLSRFKKFFSSFLTDDSWIDVEYRYRKGELNFVSDTKNTKAYNELTQILKDALSDISGPESEFYQKFIHKLELLQSYTNEEINEMREMRNKIKEEVVEKKQKQQWQDWQQVRWQKQREKEGMQAGQQQYQQYQQAQQYQQEQQRYQQQKQQQYQAEKRGQAQQEESDWTESLQELIRLKQYEAELQRKQKEQIRQQKDDPTAWWKEAQRKNEQFRQQEEQLRQQREQQQREQQRKQQEQQYQEEQQRSQQKKQQQRYKEEEQRKQKEREQEEQEEEKVWLEDLKILMSIARIEYVDLLNKYGAQVSSILSDTELDQAYKKLILKIHPDTKGDEEKTAFLNAARSKYLEAKKKLDRSKQKGQQEKRSRE